MDLNLQLAIVFFIVAVFYATVGFGGGSSYLAIMAVFGISAIVMKPTALICNIIVVSSGTYLFIKNKHLDLIKSWPIVLLSIPMAFLGGLWRISEKAFFILLGFSLIIASLLMFVDVLYKKVKNEDPASGSNSLLLTVIGGGVGFLSGMVGIGGGIFLSPVLHLMKWSNAKKIAGISSFFILVNSIAGLAGQITKMQFEVEFLSILPMAIAVFIGGQIGSRLGSVYLNPKIVKALTALLILYVGLRIVLFQLFGVTI